MEFSPLRGRSVAHGQLVLAYRTGGRSDWSIMARDGLNHSLVLGHAPRVSLAAAEVLGGKQVARMVLSTTIRGMGAVGLWCAYGTFGCPTGLTLQPDGAQVVQYADLDDEGRVFVRL